ncbi:MAG TPA: hypothetical protein VJS92_01120 [Candidatus Polarisedimenticolaceae bacterium]|nr:hypothetical protein [Candidatus Polarisedimenticolaceae bacterium]
MPVVSLERLKQRERRLRDKLAKQDKAAAGTAHRTAKKRLKRVQRRRRRVNAAAARKAAKTEPAKQEG